MNTSEQIAALRAALVTILGWRERDRNNLVEVLRWIEKIASDALAAAPAQPVPERGGWQPIETAPKDGTRILVCDHMLISLVKRHDPGGTYETWVHAPYNAENSGEPIYYGPTHWQPLPTLPTSAPDVRRSGEDG